MMSIETWKEFLLSTPSYAVALKLAPKGNWSLVVLLLQLQACSHLFNTKHLQPRGTMQNDWTMTVASWNVRFAPETLPVNPKEDSEYPWERRSAAIRQTALGLQVDILATQEGNQTQLYGLADNFALELHDVHRTWTSRFFPSFFIRKQAFAMLESGDFWLSHTPEVADSKLAESKWPRMASWVHVSLAKTNSSLLIVNVHMDGDIDAQVSVLIGQIKELRERLNPSYTVLLGDFNSPWQSDTWHRVTQELRLEGVKNGHYHRPSFHGHGASLPNRLNWHIDWILVDPQLQKDFLLSHRLISPRPRGSQFFLSDHDPVVLQIRAQQ